MAKYIDKAAVVAEIERRKRKLLDHIICESDKEWVVRTAHQFNRIIMFIDTLEVKEEVTTTDAFIKKAKEAFCKATCNGHPPRSTCTSLGTCKECDNFVKLLKRE